MSRLFEALSHLKTEQQAAEVGPPLRIAPPAAVPSISKQQANPENHSFRVVRPTAGPLALAQAEPLPEVKEVNEAVRKLAETVESPAVLVSPSPESHIVALTDPSGLGAEKFRALATRFDHLRNQRELRSFQITSSVIDEGKTLVAGNLALTFAKYFGSRTLLVEGDLHRPTLANVLGLSELRGLNHWWSGVDQELGKFVHGLNGLPLWFLPAGKPCDQPSDILRSARFAEAFAKLATQFEWIVVDSTPMLPIVDVNLWSRLVDGTLLVVREGVTPIKALKRGLQALDHPKLIGVVVNEATEFDQVGYAGQYYGGSDRGDKSAKKR
jgi:capsular exopolysaccharide synthesis family protein